MNRRRFILVALAVAALVMAGGIYAVTRLPAYLPEKPGSEILAEWVDANLKAEMKAGWATPMFWPGLGIQINDLEIKLKNENGTSEDFFKAKTIKVVADADKLIRERKIVWNEVILVEPEVFLERDSKNKFNVAKWAKSLPKKEKKPEKTPPEKNESFIKWALRDFLKKITPTGDFDLMGALAIKEISIEDMKLNIVDRGFTKKGKHALLVPVHLSNLDLKFQGAKPDKPAELELTFPFPQTGGSKSGPPLRLKAALEAPTNQEIDVKRLSLAWSGINIHRVAGKLKLKPFHFDVNLDAAASFPSVRAAALWPPIAHSKTMPDMRGEGSGRVKVHVWGPDNRKAFKVHYKGTVKAFDMMYSPGRAVGDIEHINATVYLNDGEIIMPETVVYSGGSKVTVSGKLIEEKNPIFILHPKTDFVNFDTFFPGRRTKYKRGQKMLKMRTLWRGSAQVGEGVFNKMKLTNASGRWDVTNQRVITFPELEFDACGGHYSESGSSWVNFNHPTDIKFRFDGRMKGMDVTAFTAQVFETTTFLHGVFDADGYITGIFKEGEFMTRRLDGDLKVTVKDGYFEGFNLMGKILDFLKLPGGNDFKGQKFHSMSANARLRGGVAYFGDLHVEAAQGLSADVKGWINFATEHCDLKIKLYLGGDLAKTARGLPLAGIVAGPMTTLHVRAYGHWDYLKIETWDPGEDNVPPPPGHDEGAQAAPENPVSPGQSDEKKDVQER